MFLHIGREKMVPLQKIVAILDQKLLPSNENSEDSSIILTDEGILSSPISTQTLARRIVDKPNYKKYFKE